jgi:hypothetical protein
VGRMCIRNSVQKPLRNIAKRVSDLQRRSVESVTAEWYAVIPMITVCHRTISFSSIDLISFDNAL